MSQPPAAPVLDAVGLGRAFDVFRTDQDRARYFLWGAAGRIPGVRATAAARRAGLLRRVWALRDVTFSVDAGEAVGIIGANGAGKSTLLHLVCGTLPASEGTVRSSGRIGALLELGTGFVPDLTGRENVRLSGLLHGLDDATIASRVDAIAAFADIGAYLDQPVRTYSSGMYVRLAFAVMAHIDADVLIVDEALAVGDIRFVRKCLAHLDRFRAAGGTLVLVSHDLAAVQRLCSRALWLDGGRLRMDDAPRAVTEAYFDAMIGGGRHADDQDESQMRSPGTTTNPDDVGAGLVRRGAQPRVAGSAGQVPPLRTSRIHAPAEAVTPWSTRPAGSAPDDLSRRKPWRTRKSGTYVADTRRPAMTPGTRGAGLGGARIVDVRLLDDRARPVTAVRGGERVVLHVCATTGVDLQQPVIGFYVKDRLGQHLFGENTLAAGPYPAANGGQRLAARFAFVMPRLFPGEYLVAVAIADGTQADHVHHEWRHEAWHFTSVWPGEATGLVGIDIEARWTGGA